MSYNELLTNPNPQWVDVKGYGLPATWAAVYPNVEKDWREEALGKWSAMIYILFGIIGGGGGFTYTPSGKPGPPVDPLPLRLRSLSPAKRDIIAGLAITELAEILSNSKSKSEIQKSGISIMTRAIDEMSKSLNKTNNLAELR